MIRFFVILDEKRGRMLRRGREDGRCFFTTHIERAKPFMNAAAAHRFAAPFEDLQGCRVVRNDSPRLASSVKRIESEDSEDGDVAA